MRSYLYDFNDKSGVLAEHDKRAELDDWHAGFGGADNGRNQRFLNQMTSDHLVANRNKNDKSDDLIDIILTQNVDYEVLFENTMNKVRDAEDVVNRALEIAEARYAESQAKLDEMIDRLPTLNGQKVARSDKDGQVYTLDGKRVTPDVAASVQFKGHEDSFESIQKQEDKANADFEVLDRVREDELRLGEIREELDTKPDAKRVDDLGKEAEIILERNNAILTNTADNNMNSENRLSYQAPDSLSVPTLPQ